MVDNTLTSVRRASTTPYILRSVLPGRSSRARVSTLLHERLPHLYITRCELRTRHTGGERDGTDFRSGLSTQDVSKINFASYVVTRFAGYWTTNTIGIFPEGGFKLIC